MNASIAKLTSPYYAVSRLGNFPCSVEQARTIIAFKASGKKGMIDINDSFIDIFEIQGALKREDFENYLHEKKFDWKCNQGYWHEKNQKCAHGQHIGMDKPIQISEHSKKFLAMQKKRISK